jgi:hypothetical protein
VHPASPNLKTLRVFRFFEERILFYLSLAAGYPKKNNGDDVFCFASYIPAASIGGDP